MVRVTFEITWSDETVAEISVEAKTVDIAWIALLSKAYNEANVGQYIVSIGILAVTAQ